MANPEGARTKVTSESGRLLWVLRRNGTWWPGQILSLDLVPETYMSSRRSGTPVKLLGKEDAIVEWINIETSKRVKAFRCGEFVERINEAKTLADNSGNRQSKYARIGDAILQALQLEAEQNLEDKPQYEMNIYCFPLDPDEGDHKVEGSGKLRRNSNLGNELSHYGVSSEDTSFGEQITRKRKMNSLDNSKGVQELGVGLASKRGSQVDGQSLGPQQYIDSDLDTSAAVTAVSLDNSIKTGLKPRDGDSELVTARRLPPYPESCLLPEYCGGICDPLNLYDVRMEVQASYIPQNVPFACAESGLAGHSLVGHPPNIEVLDDALAFSNDLSGGVSKVSELEVDLQKKTVVHCVPVSRIFSQLKAALGY